MNEQEADLHTFATELIDTTHDRELATSLKPLLLTQQEIDTWSALALLDLHERATPTQRKALIASIRKGNLPPLQKKAPRLFVDALTPPEHTKATALAAGFIEHLHGELDRHSALSPPLPIPWPMLCDMRERAFALVRLFDMEHDRLEEIDAVAEALRRSRGPIPLFEGSEYLKRAGTIQFLDWWPSAIALYRT